MTFKVVASQGGRIVFDQRVEAESPREARDAMKQALGLESLTGLVYAITEIPTALIEEIVAAKMAQVAVSGGRMDAAKLVREAAEAAVRTEMAAIKNRLAVLEGRKGGGVGEIDLAAPKRFDAASSTPESKRREPTRPIPAQLRAILGPDWKAIRSHYRKTRSIKQTAAHFDVPVNTLKARIRREGWGK
ncbi:MAG: hypothetical protein IAE97_06790 [Chthoniobacterales bacterium]|nr:hypothetical protein [Chthoniobacterales bacterium]